MQFWRQIVLDIYILHTAKVRFRRIVWHYQNLFLSDTITAYKLIVFNSFLQSHAKRAVLVILIPQLFKRIDLRDVLPATTVMRLEKRRKAYIVDNSFPIDWKFQVTQ